MPADGFTLPEATNLEELTWDGKRFTSTFTGVYVREVARPAITVDKAKDVRVQGGVFYPTNTVSFSIIVEQDSLLNAIVRRLTGVGQIIGRAAGKGIEDTVRQIQDEINRLIRSERFAVGCNSTVVVSRGEGGNDIFVLATGLTLAELSAAGDGMHFELSTRLSSNNGRQIKNAGADTTTATADAASSTAPGTTPGTAPANPPSANMLNVADRLVFRLKPAGSERVNLEVTAAATFDSIIPQDQLQQFTDKIKELLRGNTNVTNPNGNVKKPDEPGFNIGDFMAGVVEFVERTAKVLAGALAPRVAALVVKQINMGFTTVTKEFLTAYNIEPNTLAGRIVDIEEDGMLVAMAPRAPDDRLSEDFRAELLRHFGTVSRMIDPGRESLVANAAPMRDLEEWRRLEKTVDETRRAMAATIDRVSRLESGATKTDDA